MEQFHGTTIVSVRRKTPEGVQVAIGGDGQVTLGNIVVKGSARKVRRLYHGKVIAGFAGATADAFTLFERFEAKLEKHQGHLVRSAIELTKDWRTDRVLRRLEAMLAVADKEASLIITGNGDVLEPEHGVIAIGSIAVMPVAAVAVPLMVISALTMLLLATKSAYDAKRDYNRTKEAYKAVGKMNFFKDVDGYNSSRKNVAQRNENHLPILPENKKINLNNSN